MLLAIECIIMCILFTLTILPAQYKDPIVMIMSYPPNIIKRVEELPQYQGKIKQREKAHIKKKLFGVVFLAVLFALIAYCSGSKDFLSAFIHVFVMFFAVNIYDLVVLDWGVFCHSKKLRIAGTEDMDKDYKDYIFHVKGAVKGTIIGIVVALLAASVVLVFNVI